LNATWYNTSCGDPANVAGEFFASIFAIDFRNGPFVADYMRTVPIERRSIEKRSNVHG
jgi:hypothetical protein